jgi:hypothetical protein
VGAGAELAAGGIWVMLGTLGIVGYELVCGGGGEYGADGVATGLGKLWAGF